MIKDLWDIAQGLLGLKNNFMKAKRDRKDRIAEYFSTIGNIIQDAADIFKKGEVPHGKCQQMLDQAKLFSGVVGDTIDKDKAQEFQQKLVKSHKVEMLASEILEQDGAGKKISELERISGSFLALGSAIKAAK